MSREQRNRVKQCTRPEQASGTEFLRDNEKGYPGSTGSPRIGPGVGNHWGARRWRCWPRIVVLVVVGGGGGEGKDGMVTICDVGDVSNVVARFGNPQAPINN